MSVPKTATRHVADPGGQARPGSPGGLLCGGFSKDLEAAAAASCQGVLVLTGNGKETLRSFPDHQATFTDLAEFVDHLLLR